MRGVVGEAAEARAASRSASTWASLLVRAAMRASVVSNMEPKADMVPRSGWGQANKAVQGLKTVDFFIIYNKSKRGFIGICCPGRKRQGEGEEGGRGGRRALPTGNVIMLPVRGDPALSLTQRLALLAAVLCCLLLVSQPSPRPHLQQRRWSATLPSGTPLRLAYAGFPAGFDLAVADRELWLLAFLVEQATRRPTQPINHTLPLERQLAGADVIIANGFAPGGRVELEGQLARHRQRGALTVWWMLENVARPAYAPYEDQMLGHVHAAFGPRADLHHSTYLHLGAWISHVLQRPTGCTLPQAWARAAPGAPSPAIAWRARPGFAAIVASHGDPPRAELCAALAGAGLGGVEGGGAFLGTPATRLPPPDLRVQSEAQQKAAFLARYRFTVCPENSRSWAGEGYVTEKLPQALLAGAVPI